MKRLTITLTAFTFIFISCKNHTQKPKQEDVPEESTQLPSISYSIEKAYPHDTTSFTEGLLVHNGQLFESTGGPGQMPNTKSLFGVVDLKTGKIEPKAELDKSQYFGEGIVFMNGNIYQLTYKSRTGFIYDGKTFKKTGEFSFPSKEGWGLTTDGAYLIMSDGTSSITYLDPRTFRTAKMVTVMDNSGPVTNLNELEFIHGFIYANVYTTNYILKINPKTGRVLARLDLNELAHQAKINYPGSLELNGIAYDSSSDKIYITGKMWPRIFEIKFTH